ncbi:MAG: metallophosphoesterase [Myxococcales bacterium]|nr:MAG: metallophosphoesterase [Myxococcales bacterium]
MRLAVSSDLHFDRRGHLTTPAAVADVAARLRAARPDVVVLAGDIAHGLDNIRGGIEAFVGCAPVVAVLAGNHDVWRDDALALGSRQLFDESLPALCAELGVTWLENTVIRHGTSAVVGSLAWYDYSAVDPSQAALAPHLASLKRLHNADAHRVDWPNTDPDVAARLADGLMARLAAVAADPTITSIAVVTHVPLLDEQLIRKPDDPRWGLSNAYFGHLTLGARVAAEPRVTLVVSGHTHGARAGVRDRPGMPPLRYSVIGSDYGEPVGEVFEVSSRHSVIAHW